MVKSGKAAYCLSIIPGLGHYYLGRYLRGSIFTAMTVGLFAVLVYVFNLSDDDRYTLFITLPICLIIGTVYLSASDVENVCANINNGKYGNKVQVDGSKDSDSQGGMYCVSFYLVGVFLIVMSVIFLIEGYGWKTMADHILCGLLFGLIGFIVNKFIDTKNVKMLEQQ